MNFFLIVAAVLKQNRMATIDPVERQTTQRNFVYIENELLTVRVRDASMSDRRRDGEISEAAFYKADDFITPGFGQNSAGIFIIKFPF